MKFDSFLGTEHRQKIAKLENLWKSLHDLAEYAAEYGITDIFQDNGAKVLQQLIYLNMLPLAGREGNDAISQSGVEWEMKSINLDTSATGFSTNHHTNREILEKYRHVPWTFAIYHGLHLSEIYVMTPSKLEPLFSHWEKKLDKQTHLNNPKIPVAFVRENGILVYPYKQDHQAVDPDTVAQSLSKQP